MTLILAEKIYDIFDQANLKGSTLSYALSIHFKWPVSYTVFAAMQTINLNFNQYTIQAEPHCRRSPTSILNACTILNWYVMCMQLPVHVHYIFEVTKFSSANAANDKN